MTISYGPDKGSRYYRPVEAKAKPPEVIPQGMEWNEDVEMLLPTITLETAKHHVDDWVEGVGYRDTDGEKYAKFVLMHMRLHAGMQNAFRPWTKQFSLFCDFAGITWRVTGASRLGDIWLAKTLEQTEGSYDLRRYVNECSNWRATP